MINLLINFYADPDPARNEELLTAFNRNVALFDRIIYWPDDPDICITSRETSIMLGGGSRPTIAAMFQSLNGCIGPADITVLANADISFNDSIRLAEPAADECFALTRWEIPDADHEEARVFSDKNGKPRIDSQDAWIFRGPIRPELLPTGKFAPMFTLGTAGCDNALAYRFRAAGYRLSNPSLSIHAWHHHRSQVRRYSRDQNACVPMPYAMITPHELGTIAHVDVRF